MFYRWLDRWDERRASIGENLKESADFKLGTELCFPNANQKENIESLFEFSNNLLKEPKFFDEPDDAKSDFSRVGNWLEFSSEIETDVHENNTVSSKVSEGGGDHALLVFHHWNATKRQTQLADFFSRRGITVVEMAMPYHLERKRPGSTHADYMLGPNIGRTIQSVRQSVLDGRKVIRYLKSEGYKKISVVGFSLGSWIASLLSAHEPAVTKCSLFLSAGSLADMVWTGRATRLVKESLAPNMDIFDLRKAWAPTNAENYADLLGRPELKLQLVLAKRDKVVLPNLSHQFVMHLRNAGVDPTVVELNCGHYSISKPPFILLAAWSLDRFLKQP